MTITSISSIPAMEFGTARITSPMVFSSFCAGIVTTSFMFRLPGGYVHPERKNAKVRSEHVNRGDPFPD